MNSWNLLLDIVTLLGCSLIFGGLFARFRQSPLVGYLLAGMVLGGPGSLALIESAEDLEIIAELGVSLLLFSLGLEFSWSRLKSLGMRALLAGALQVGITAAVASGALWLLQFSVREALALGAMVSLSSTACVLRVLMERGESESVHGRSSIAILLVQDMAVVPHAIVLTLLGRSGATAFAIAADVANIVFAAAILIASLYFLLNIIAIRVLGRLTLEINRELAVLLAVVTGLGSAWAAHQASISPALGAFVAGMLLGSSPFATQIRADISSLRVVLLTLFFSAAGMGADPVWIVMNLPLVLTTTLVLLVGKTLVIWVVLKALGQPSHVAFATGLILSQIGEFAFVLGSIGQENGVLRAETYQLIISSAILTLFITPYLVPAAPRLGLRLAALLRQARPTDLRENYGGEGHHPEILIIGFGPAGETAAAPLVGSGRKVLVCELNRESVQRAMALGFEGLIGDARQMEVLEHAGAGSAKVVLITIPDYFSSMAVLQQIRRLAPDATLVVRSRYQRHIDDFQRAGAHVVIGDEEIVGKSLAEALS
ncbi:MAG: cation:proton antiporter [Bdellovibrionales bacterium]|nr:cation:proton antiporter [Bdellovibrionales bacterium]